MQEMEDSRGWQDKEDESDEEDDESDEEGGPDEDGDGDDPFDEDEGNLENPLQAPSVENDQGPASDAPLESKSLYVEVCPPLIFSSIKDTASVYNMLIASFKSLSLVWAVFLHQLLEAEFLSHNDVNSSMMNLNHWQQTDDSTVIWRLSDEGQDWLSQYLNISDNASTC